MPSTTSPRRRAAAGPRRCGNRGRDVEVRDWAVWALGLVCGLGVAAFSETASLLVPTVLLAAGTLPLGIATLRRFLQPRRRVLVWEEPPWQLQR